MILPYGHWLIYGDPGSGKSSGAATFPKPMHVCMFDGFGKETPYLQWPDGRPRGTLTEIAVDRDGTPYLDVASLKDGRLLIRIAYFLDADPENPEAWQRFRLYMHSFDPTQWATVVGDSLTNAELFARKRDEYVTNRGAKEPRQHWNASMHDLEEMFYMRWAAFPTNVVILAHIEEKQDQVHGHMIFNPDAPGKLHKRFPANYSELYRAHVERDPTTKERRYLWQTRSDGRYNATTQINAPDPTAQDYRLLGGGQ